MGGEVAMTTQFMKFLVTGGVAAAVNLISRVMLNWAMPFEVAVVIAYLFGMATAYLLSRQFVFAASGRSVLSEVKRFTVVNLFALLLVWVVSVGLAKVVFPAVHLTWHANDIAHLIGVLAPAVTSFVGHKRYTFGRVRPGERA
jgi:putative flippase GtrA